MSVSTRNLARPHAFSLHEKWRSVMAHRIDRGSDDPDGTAAEARAVLKRNTEIGLAPQESDLERKPSVAPETFGEGDGFREDGARKPGEADAMTRAEE
jgi:hypothetical protein